MAFSPLRSIRVRLTFWYAMTLAVILAVSALFSYHYFSHHLREQIDRQIREIARTIDKDRAAIVSEENGDSNPDFLSGPENYHIDSDSPAVDAGDPNGYYGMERDIDGQFRLIGDAVDIGADETCVDTYFSPADFNDDGIVNLTDYQELAAVWLDDSPPFDPNCDLNADAVIDMLDLALFTNDWLWFACAYHSPQPNLLLARGGGDGGKAGSMEFLSIVTLLSAKTTTAASITNPALPEVKIITLKELVELIRWTEELWLTHPEIRKHTTVEEWNDFLRRLYLAFAYLE